MCDYPALLCVMPPGLRMREERTNKNKYNTATPRCGAVSSRVCGVDKKSDGSFAFGVRVQQTLPSVNL